MSPVIIQLTTWHDSRLRCNLRFLFMLTGLVGGAVVSHLIAASWIIECTFVLLCFLGTWVFFDAEKPIYEANISMTPAELRAYLDAGCPREWPARSLDASRGCKHTENNRSEPSTNPTDIVP